MVKKLAENQETKGINSVQLMSQTRNMTDTWSVYNPHLPCHIYKHDRYILKTQKQQQQQNPFSSGIYMYIPQLHAHYLSLSVHMEPLWSQDQI